LIVLIAGIFAPARRAAFVLPIPFVLFAPVFMIGITMRYRAVIAFVRMPVIAAIAAALIVVSAG
jgi:hypothetical protein